MAPVENAEQIIRQHGADMLGDLILQATKRLPINRGVIQEAFKPPTILSSADQINFFGTQRPLLAELNHDLKLDPSLSYPMKDWIPEVDHYPGGGEPGNDPKVKVLDAFGIKYLARFAFTGNRLIKGEQAPTQMILEEPSNSSWMFVGYNRNARFSFNCLRECLWTIAMLPSDITKKIISQGCVLIMQEGGNVSIEQSDFAKITPAASHIFVEGVNDMTFKTGYQNGTIEANTPVVLFHYR